MRKIHVHGSTLSSGRTLRNEYKQSMSNLLASKLGIPVVNCAVNGASNDEIFVRVINSIINSDADFSIIEWTGPGNDRYVTSLGKVVPGEVDADSVYNQYLKLSDYVPIVHTLAKRYNKKVMFWTSYLPFYSEFFSMPSTQGTSIDYSKWSHLAVKLIDPDGNTPKALKDARANSIRSLMMSIGEHKWINQFKYVPLAYQKTDEYAPELIHMDMASKVLSRVRTEVTGPK
jgi:hypothetical protein